MTTVNHWESCGRCHQAVCSCPTGGCAVSPLDAHIFRNTVDFTAAEKAARELGVVFVVDAKDLPDSRHYAAPLTRVGPVRSGSLREFEDPLGSKRPRGE